MSENINDLVQEYRDIRDNLDAARHEYQDKEKMAKGRMAEISMRLREISDQLGVDSFRTPSGTAYRTTKESFRVGNWDDILKYIRETDNWQMLEKRIAKLATKEIYQTDGVLPPGVEYEAEVEFVVRKS